MYYVYVLKSKKDGKNYIGYTKDLKNRLILNNEGKVTSTAQRKPFDLVYYEAYKSSFDAKGREFQLKRGKRAYEQLRGRIEKSIE